LLVEVSVVWSLFSVALGWIAVHTPDRRLGEGPFTRLRQWERSLAAYRVVGIRRWKDRLPEAGDLFVGGVSKRQLPDRSIQTLQRFVIETRRGERVHWTLPFLALTFISWTPGVFAVLNVLIAIVINAPFIVIQRYNRIRLERTIRRAGSDPDELCNGLAPQADVVIR
jgi:glycosyl-4,4'-diaponeurosporenoate acyltransferase